MASCGNTTLKFGAKNDKACTKYLNELLIARRALAARDVADVTYFGPTTSVAVREFQANANIEVDGVVGPQTWKALGEAVSMTNVFNEVNPNGVNVGTNPGTGTQTVALTPVDPGSAPPGLIERLKTGFSEMEPWKKWAVIAGGITAVLGVAYVASTPRKASLSGFVDFLNGDEPSAPSARRTKTCGRTTGEDTLADAEDVLPEA